jgi:hypothetical protein
VAQPFAVSARAFVAGLFVSCAVGCSTADTRLDQHQEKVRSLRATAAFVADSWLAGKVSGVYAGTSLERAEALLDKERSELATTAQDLADSRGALLSERAERLARVLATTIEDVRRGDRNAVRQQLAVMSVERE